MRRTSTFLFLLLALPWQTVSPSAVHSAGDAFERISLKGLRAVQVVVEDLSPDIVQDGLNSERIKSAVEQQLMQAGINAEQQSDTALYVRVGSAKNEAGLYSYTLSLQLLQLVFLFRDPSLVTWGTTWNLDQTGSLAPANVPDLQSLIARAVNSFIDDYQAANPTLRE